MNFAARVEAVRKALASRGCNQGSVPIIVTPQWLVTMEAILHQETSHELQPLSSGKVAA